MHAVVFEQNLKKILEFADHAEEQGSNGFSKGSSLLPPRAAAAADAVKQLPDLARLVMGGPVYPIQSA